MTINDSKLSSLHEMPDGSVSLKCDLQESEGTSLLDENEDTGPQQEPSYLTQYLTTAAATSCVLALGTLLGYSSPANARLSGVDHEKWHCFLPNGIALTDLELSWFSASINIGALVGCPLGGFSINVFGRRGTALITVIPFLLGWGFIVVGNSVPILVVGRIFGGICCGVVSVCVPTYIGEISSPGIRGFLGSGFEVMLVGGVMYAIVIGAFVCWKTLAVICAIPAVVSAIGMYFCNESPTFLMMKGKEEAARKSLQHFRGDHYDINPELQRLRVSVEEIRHRRTTLDDFRASHVSRPLMISLALMFFQQYSGVSSLAFNLTSIFQSARVDVSADASSAITTVVQVVSTFIGAILMDKAGRRTLLMVSSIAMTFSLCAISLYFYRLERGMDVSYLWWLPLASLVSFVFFYGIGLGPIPWVMVGELFPADVRESAASIVTLSLWFHSFVTTFTYRSLRNAMGDSGVCCLYAAVCAVTFFFSFFVVKETKGKTIEDISNMFRENKPEIRKSTSI